MSWCRVILSLKLACARTQLGGRCGGCVQEDAVPAPQVPLKVLEFEYEMARTHEEKRAAAQKISDLMEVGTPQLCVRTVGVLI